MKKTVAASMALVAALTLSACGEEETSSKSEANEAAETTKETTVTTTDVEDEEVHPHTPEEPGHNEECAFCNMEVYGHDHTMGAFTAQAITQSGERVFFDDSGCLLNYERKTEEEYLASWVRDYATNEWIEADQAVAVQSDIATPMKYGYAFFSDDSQAETFISENEALNPSSVTWENIDTVANERYMKKMQSMNQSHTDEHDEHTQDSMHSNTHE